MKKSEIYVVLILSVALFLVWEKFKSNQSPDPKEQVKLKSTETVSPVKPQKINSPKKTSYILPKKTALRNVPTIKDIFTNKERSCWLNTVLGLFTCSPSVYEKISLKAKIDEIQAEMNQETKTRFDQYFNVWFLETQVWVDSNFINLLNSEAEIKTPPIIDQKKLGSKGDEYWKEKETEQELYIRSIWSNKFNEYLEINEEKKDKILEILTNIQKSNRTVYDEKKKELGEEQQQGGIWGSILLEGGEEKNPDLAKRQQLYLLTLQQQMKALEMGLQVTQQDIPGQKSKLEQFQKEAILSQLKAISNILNIAKNLANEKDVVDFIEVFLEEVRIEIFYTILGPGGKEKIQDPLAVFRAFKEIAELKDWNQIMNYQSSLIADFQSLVLKNYSCGSDFQSSIFLADMMFFPGFNKVNLLIMSETSFETVGQFNEIIKDPAFLWLSLSSEEYKHYTGLVKSTQWGNIKIDDISVEKIAKYNQDPHNIFEDKKRYGLAISPSIYLDIPLKIKSAGFVLGILNYVQCRSVEGNTVITASFGNIDQEGKISHKGCGEKEE